MPFYPYDSEISKKSYSKKKKISKKLILQRIIYCHNKTLYL